MRPRGKLVALAALALLLIGAGAALAQTGGGYDITWWTVDTGGGNTAGGVYTASGTAGQAEAGAEATGGAYGLTGGVWGQLGGTLTVVISRQAPNVVLTWADVSGLQSYEVWRDTRPYLAPAAPAVLVASGYPPAGCTLTSGTITCALAGGTGDPNVNYFYVVRGVRPDLSTVDSNRTGEFDFGVVKGG